MFNIGRYFVYRAALFIIGCIFVFWIILMFQKKTSVDCSGNWGDWYCAATCDGINAISSRTGTRKRTYAVTTPASNGGASCPVYAPQTDSTCTKTDCPVNCIGDWNEWSACAATCDGINAISSRTGTRTRTYRVTTPASYGGTSCPVPQTDTCTKTDCSVTIATIATTSSSACILASYPYVPSSGDKYIVFNYTSDSVGLTGQTEYIFNVLFEDFNATILIVGGGGAGGGRVGGGGGGGDVSLNNITIPVGTHKIRVGRGGSGGVSPGSTGERGYNSELILESGITYTYCGGGGGCGGWNDSATAGLSNGYSSGGGGGGGSNSHKAGGSGNGFSGNGGNVVGAYIGKAGGGGATGNGGDGNDNSNGNGGRGVTSDITGSNVGYGGGGGGAATSNNNNYGLGVDGGGISIINGIAGINGTGGGGCGGRGDKGGKGGDGVVIIRYCNPSSICNRNVSPRHYIVVRNP